MAPASPNFTALESHSGNDLLLERDDQREALLAKIKTWPSTGKKITNRLPAFVLTEKLVAQAVGLAEQAEWSATLIARRANRSLVLEAGCRTVVGKIFGGIGWLRELVTHKFVAHPPPSALRAGLAGTALFRPAPK
jgi:hypothetical protein